MIYEVVLDGVTRRVEIVEREGKTIVSLDVRSCSLISPVPNRKLSPSCSMEDPTR